MMALVLIVDADADAREAIGVVLTHEGHRVLLADTAQRTLRLLRRATFRWVVLFDYRMPDLDGLAFLQAIAADRHLARQHAYVAMTAGSPDLHVPLAVVRAELEVPLLRKPFTVDELLDTIAQAALRLQG